MPKMKEVQCKIPIHRNPYKTVNIEYDKHNTKYIKIRRLAWNFMKTLMNSITNCKVSFIQHQKNYSCIVELQKLKKVGGKPCYHWKIGSAKMN